MQYKIKNCVRISKIKTFQSPEVFFIVSCYSLYTRLSSCKICIEAPVRWPLIQVSSNASLITVALYVLIYCHTLTASYRVLRDKLREVYLIFINIKAGVSFSLRRVTQVFKAQNNSVLQKMHHSLPLKSRWKCNSEITMVNWILIYFHLKIYIVLVDCVKKKQVFYVLCKKWTENSLSVLIRLLISEILKGPLYLTCVSCKIVSVHGKLEQNSITFRKKIPTV